MSTVKSSATEVKVILMIRYRMAVWIVVVFRIIIFCRIKVVTYMEGRFCTILLPNLFCGNINCRYAPPDLNFVAKLFVSTCQSVQS